MRDASHPFSLVAGRAQLRRSSRAAEVEPTNKLELLTKIGGIALALTYAAGFLTVNTHLGKNGFDWLGLFDATYIAAGLWALAPILLGFFLASVAMLLFRDNKARRDKTSDKTAAMSAAKRALHRARSAFLLAFVPVSVVVWSLDHVDWIAFAWPLGTLIIFIFMVTTNAYALIFAIASSLTVVVFPALIYKAFGVVGIQPSSAWWLLPIVIGAALPLGLGDTVRELVAPQNSSTRKADVNGIVFLLLLAPAYFATFAVRMYPDIPAHFAGGRPANVRLIANQTSAPSLQAAGIRINNGVSQSVWLFKATEGQLLIKAPDSGIPVVLQRNLIDSIMFARR